MHKKSIGQLSAVSIAVLLTACGGGGGSSTPTSTGSSSSSSSSSLPTPTNTGSVSSPFVGNSNAQYVLNGVGLQSSGLLSPSQQNSAGGMTTLGKNTLTGSPTAIEDMSGDATYAMGRWMLGTATTIASTNVLTGKDNSAYHYVAYNQLSSLPTTGTMTCNSGTFTSPSYVGGNVGNVQPSAYFGSATGNATLSFSSAGAAVSVNLTATAGGSSGTGAFSGTIATANSSVIKGNYYGSSTGALLTVGDGGSGKVFVVAPYTIALANTASYTGIALFRCQ